jgi:hypothetical protein
MEVDIMINFEELLLKIVAELPLSEFEKACEKAGINQYLKEDILNLMERRGV